MEFRAGMPGRYRVFLYSLGAAIAGSGLLIPLLAGRVNTAAAVLGVLAAAFIIVAARMQTVVHLGADSVRIRTAGIFSTTIPYEQITDVAIAPPTGLAAGMGLRIFPGRTTGYLVGGPAIRITTGRSSVLVSADAPACLLAGILRRCPAGG